MNRIKIRDITDAMEELNSACSLLEDVLGDYQEIAVAMDKINAVIDFLYENVKIEKIRKLDNYKEVGNDKSKN